MLSGGLPIIIIISDQLAARPRVRARPSTQNLSALRLCLYCQRRRPFLVLQLAAFAFLCVILRILDNQLESIYICVRSGDKQNFRSNTWDIPLLLYRLQRTDI